MIDSFEHGGMTVEIRRMPSLGRHCYCYRLQFGDIVEGVFDEVSEEEIQEFFPRVFAYLPLRVPGSETQVGWAWITHSRARAKGWEGWSDEKLLDTIRAEVSYQLAGEVHGYVIKDAHGVVVDSCWGFRDVEDCRTAARASIG